MLLHSLSDFRNSKVVSRNSSITWEYVQHVTRGRIGRHMATCPECSALRRTPQKRNSKVLAITLQEPEFSVHFCNHCEASGYCRPDKPSRPIDLVEQQRRREEARRYAETKKSARTQRALELWHESRPFRGSPAEDYLLYTRGIGDWLDTFPYLDQVLRFHSSCPFGDERLPCMLALVRDIKTDVSVAIHRTALRLGDRPERIERKSLGPTSGGAIKISPEHEVTMGLLIGEGIETVLSASKQFQFKPVWSLIDKGNLARFPVLSGIECLTVAIDNDLSGDGGRAADQCVRRQVAGGVEVITARTNLAKDFNDLIKEQIHVQGI
jgi:putative DNA primase/helicase